MVSQPSAPLIAMLSSNLLFSGVEPLLSWKPGGKWKGHEPQSGEDLGFSLLDLPQIVSEFEILPRWGISLVKPHGHKVACCWQKGSVR